MGKGVNLGKAEYLVYPELAKDNTIEYLYLDDVYLVNPNYLEELLNRLIGYGYTPVNLASKGAV
jgi:hypothetical protein